MNDYLDFHFFFVYTIAPPNSKSWLRHYVGCCWDQWLAVLLLGSVVGLLLLWLKSSCCYCGWIDMVGCGWLVEVVVVVVTVVVFILFIYLLFLNQSYGGGFLGFLWFLDLWVLIFVFVLICDGCGLWFVVVDVTLGNVGVVCSQTKRERERE